MQIRSGIRHDMCKAEAARATERHGEPGSNTAGQGAAPQPGRVSGQPNWPKGRRDSGQANWPKGRHDSVLASQFLQELKQWLL
jgi:hypothetical protein